MNKEDLKNKKLPDFKKIIQKLFFLIPLGILGNILFTYYYSDNKILISFSDFNYFYLFLAMAASVVPWITHSFRIFVWSCFLNKKLRPKNLAEIAIGTDLGAALTPTAVGGSYVKIGLLYKNGFSLGESISVNLLGSLEDFLFFVVAIPSAFLLTDSSNLITYYFQLLHFNLDVVYISLSVILMLSLLIFSLNKIKNKLLIRIFGRIHNKFLEIWSEFKKVYVEIGQKGKLLLLINVMVTGIQWITKYSIITFLLYGLNIPIHPVKAFLLQWVIFNLLVLVPSPGAMGGAEAFFYFIYKSFIPESMIGFVVTGWRFLTFYFVLTLGALIFYFLSIRRSQSFRIGNNVNLSEV